MRIMFIVPQMVYGGTERQIAVLSGELSNRGHIVMIYSVYNEECRYVLDSSVQYIAGTRKKARVKKWNTINIKEIKNIGEIVDQFGPDIIIPFFLIPIIYTLIIRMKKHTFILVTSERSDPIKYSLIKRFILDIAYRLSDGFVCQSRQIYEYYDDVSLSNKTIIPNAVSIKTTDASVKKDDTIIAVGRLVKNKRYDVLINAFNLIKDEFPSLCLKIYGSGELEDEIIYMIEKYKLTDRVLLKGTTNDIYNEMKKSYLCVITSDYEGFPNVMIEAMAAGLPVVSTDFLPGNAREILGDSGIVVEKANYVVLGRAIAHILWDDKIREEMGQIGLMRAKDYSICEVSDKWESMLLRLLERK